jgi:hypothetical protein
MRACSRIITALCLALTAFAAGAQQDLEPGVRTSPAPAPVSAPASAPPGAGAAPGTINGNAKASQPPAGKPAAASTKATPPAAAPAAAPAGGPVAASGPAPKAGKSSDRIQLDTTQISGNRELPKVMYVVPWRRADPGEFTGRPLNSLLDEALAPVDRDVFRRQNRYYSALAGEPGSDKSQPGAAGDGAAAPTPKDEK